VTERAMIGGGGRGPPKYATGGWGLDPPVVCLIKKMNMIILVLLNSYKTADSNCSYRRPIGITRCMLVMHSSSKTKLLNKYLVHYDDARYAQYALKLTYNHL
jgi:hypothetical protein